MSSGADQSAMIDQLVQAINRLRGDSYVTGSQQEDLVSGAMSQDSLLALAVQLRRWLGDAANVAAVVGEIVRKNKLGGHVMIPDYPDSTPWPILEAIGRRSDGSYDAWDDFTTRVGSTRFTLESLIKPQMTPGTLARLEAA